MADLGWDPDGLLKGKPKADTVGATDTPGPRSDRRSASEAGLAAKAALTPEEQADDIANRHTDRNFAMLEQAIRDEKDPKARAILVEERATLEAERKNRPADQPDRAPAKAKPWAQVAASAAYKALSSDDQEAARLQYFRDVVAPQVKTDELADARAQFDEDTKPTLIKSATKAVKESGLVDVVSGVAKGALDWAREGVLGKTSVMDGPLPDLANQPGAVAPMSQQGMNTSAAVASAIGAPGVDALKDNPGVIARSIVQASEDPQRQAEQTAAANALTPAPKPDLKAAPFRTPAEKYAEYKKNYPMLGPDDIRASIARDLADGTDRSSPVPKAKPGQTQPTMQDWLARHIAQAQADAGAYVAPTLARGTAQLAGGLTEFVTGLLPSTFNHFVVNPILSAAGSSFQFPMVSGMGAEFTDRVAYRNPASKTALKSWDDLKGWSQTADWLGEHVVEQAPQMAAMMTAAFAPRALANLYLLAMGGSSAGSQYRQNVLAHPDKVGANMTEAWTEGAIETLSEMLPLAVFKKVQGAVAGLSIADKAGFVGRLMRAAGVSIAATGAHQLTEGLEEIVAQVGQNIAKRYMLGEDVKWNDGVTEAGIIGAVSGAAMGIPHTAAAAMQALAPQQGDGVAARAARAGILNNAQQQAARRGIPGGVDDVLSGDAATPGAGGSPPGGGGPRLALPAPGMTTPGEGQLVGDALADLRDFVDANRGRGLTGEAAQHLDALVAHAKAAGATDEDITDATMAPNPDDAAAAVRAKRDAAEKAREAGMAEIARQGTMKKEIAQGQRRLPAPETPTGRNGFVNDGEFTRPETFEDQQNRLDSLARMAVQREEAARRAANGLTPDVERAQARRTQREAGIDPNGTPEPIAPMETNSVVAIAKAAPLPDVTRADGTPFKTEAAAQRAKKPKKVPHNWKLTKVDGGFVWRAPQPRVRAPKATPVDNAASFKAAAKNRFITALKKAGGLNIDEAADFTGERNRFRANQRLPGVFRHGGMSIDSFGEMLHEDGYITDAEFADADGSSYARQLIADAMAGEFVGTPEERNGYYARLQAEHADAEISASGFEQLAEPEQAEVADYDDSGEFTSAEADFAAEPNATEGDLMRALGFTDEEIADAIKSRAGKAAGSQASGEGPAREAGGDEPRSPESRGPPDAGPPAQGQGNGRRPPGDPEGEAGVAAEPEPKPKTPPQGGVSVSGPLYASRPVLNADAIIAWAQSQGFKTTLPAADMHVTVAYSKAPIDGAKAGDAKPAVVVLGGKRSVEPLGDEGAVVLKISSKDLQARWQQYRDAGASWDYEGYQPHITITYDGKGVDLSKVDPYRGAIKLGAEKQEQLNVDKADEYVEEPTSAAKADLDAGLKDLGDLLGAKPNTAADQIDVKQADILKRAAAVYAETLATGTPIVDAKIWREELSEQAENPTRYHPKAEVENPKGLKIGDAVTVAIPASKSGRPAYTVHGRVTSIEIAKGKANKSGFSVSVLPSDAYEIAVDLGSVEKAPPGGGKTEESAPAGQHDMSREGAQIATLNTLRDRFKRGDNMDEFKGGESSNRTGGFTIAVQTSRAKHGEVTATGYQVDYTFKLKDLVAILKAEASVPAEKQEAETVPESVKTHIKWALGQLRDVEFALAGVERARGRGHNLALEIQDQAPKVAKARKALDEFRTLAKGKGIDPEATIKDLGGEPDLARFDVTPVKAEPKAPVAKKPVVTPQVASAGMLKTFIGIAADSIEQLRKQDVDRVLTSNPIIYQQAIASYIKENRPDLAEEVDAVLAESKAAPALELTSQTPEEAAAAAKAADDAAKAEAKAKADKEKGERDARVKNEIADRSHAAAGEFQLGQTQAEAEATLAGQGDIFSQPAAKPAGPAELKAKADLMSGLADLADLIGKNAKLNLTPEQEQKLLPVLTRIFDAAFRLGHIKFKQAAKYVLDQIRAALGTDIANEISLDHLQGAYITMAGRYKAQGAEGIAAVSGVADKADIEAHVDEPAAPAQDAPKEKPNVPSSDADLERDRPDAAAPQPAVGGVDGARGARAPGKAGKPRTAPGVVGGASPGDTGVSNGGTAPIRERGDLPVYSAEGEPLPSDLPPGVDDAERGDLFGERGVRAPAGGSDPAPQAARPVDIAAKRRKQLAARGVPVVLGNRANIEESLPFLNHGQQGDVAFAEARFAKDDGYGVLFTNGTGTGKTYTGLGIAYRFERQGKTNILIAAPSQKVVEDWIMRGKNLGLDIRSLADTQDNGRKGIVITTYKNLGDNDSLGRREWDLVITDEAHYLMQGADGESTLFLDNLRAITKHPRGVERLAEMRHPREHLAMVDANQAYQAARDAKKPKQELDRLQAAFQTAAHAFAPLRQKVIDDVEASQGAKRTRVTFLSATPFAYEKCVDYAEGYLFNYPAEDTRGGYNSGGSFQRFMMQNFGYSMRYNKLTEPGPEVDRGLMQRNFNSMLKRQQVLSGRMLDVVPDYDRKFVLVESSIGRRIDEALAWLRENGSGADRARGAALGHLRDIITEQFNYLERRFLLEGLKATEAIPIIRAHHALGRKVVVFHDYKMGSSGRHPFKVRIEPGLEIGYYDKDKTVAKAMVEPVYDEFKAAFPDLMKHPFENMTPPITALAKAFPNAQFVNGSLSTKVRSEAVNRFQTDGSPYNLIVVQSAAGKEGISLHDETGAHQRVLINLGLPTQPTTAIQQEGRIYRTGQQSDAMMRYLNTGTSWEREAFANTVARRASTAENLAQGEGARGLLDSFIQAFNDTDSYAPGHEGEGKGGKAADKALNDALTEYDRAKSYYFAQQKKNSRTKAQEGIDYYATPEPVGLKMVEWLRLRAGESALEPSAGHGAIARWLPDNTKRRAIEPSNELATKLALAFDGEIVQDRFENHNIVNKYDGIVMNPPFGSGGKDAVDHLEKAWGHLREGGRIVALLPRGTMADKRLEKFLEEGQQKLAKPIFTDERLGPIFRGDTLTIDAYGTTQKMVVWDIFQNEVQSYLPNPAAFAMPKGGDTSSAINLIAVTKVDPTGKALVKKAEAPQLVADIQLPTVTFQRAGTGVMTHIIVLQKGAFDGQTIKRDYTSEEDIKGLFDRIQDLDMPDRPAPKPQEWAMPRPMVGNVSPAPANPLAALLSGRDGKLPNAPAAAPASAAPIGSLVAFDQPHTQKGGTQYMAAFAGRVESDIYSAALAVANKHGGYYSRYQSKATNTKAGFTFPTAAQRDAFVAEASSKPGGAVFSRGRAKPSHNLQDGGELFGLSDADEDAVLTMLDEQEIADYEKAKPRGMSWLDYARQSRNALHHDQKGGGGRGYISSTHGEDSPWRETGARLADDDNALRSLRGEAVKLEKGAPAYLYVNQDGTATITVVDARDVPQRMLDFAARHALKVDVVVRPSMAGTRADVTMPDEYRESGAKYAEETGPVDSQKPSYKHADNGIPLAGLSLAGARLFVKNLIANWHNAPPIHVMGSPSEAPFEAPDDASGAMYRGEIYLFASNLRDLADLQFTLFHEAHGHVGLHGLLGAEMDSELRRIAILNAGVRRAAAAWMVDYGRDAIDAHVKRGTTRQQAERAVSMLAIEEALADMAGAGKTISGLQRFMAKVQALLRAIGLEKVAAWLENATDAEVASLLARAKTWVEEGSHSVTGHDMAATYSQKAPIFFSALAHSIAQINARALTAEGWWQHIESLNKKGVIKGEELQWTAIEEWLSLQEGKVSKDAVLAYLRDNQVQVESTVLGKNRNMAAEEETEALLALGYRPSTGPGGHMVGVTRISDGVSFSFSEDEEALGWGDEMTDDNVGLDVINVATNLGDLRETDLPTDNEAATKFDSWQPPGGKPDSYREVVITLPVKRTWLDGSPVDESDPIERANADRLPTESPDTFQSNHWDQPNVVAHYRADVVTGPDGKRYLRPFEFQSDWGQKGKKEGFGNTPATAPAGWANTNDARSTGGGVPRAPFVTKTEAWLTLAIKRAIRMAVDEGLDGLVLSTGEQMADVFDLSKHIDRVYVTDHSDEGLRLFAFDKGGATIVAGKSVTEKTLADNIGKDAAEKLLQQKPAWKNARETRELSGLDLKVGGEGMRTFYDKIVPNTVNDVLKKLGGGRLGTVKIDTIVRTSNGSMEAGDHMDRQENPDFKTQSVPGVEFNQALRDKASSGMPLFSRRAGEATTGSDTLAAAVEAVDAEIPKATKSRARRAIERMDALFEPLGQLPDKNVYLTERYKTLGRIARVDEIAGAIGKVFKRASEEDRAAAYEYLTTAGASPLAIKDEATRQQAITTKALIGSVGDGLVARGLLSEEAREEYRDRYLPRLYLKHVLTESDYKAIGGGKKASDMGYLKARKDIPEDVRAVILGEITDPGFLAATGVAKPMRDMALLDWLAQISGNAAWVDKGSVAQWKGTPVSVRWLQLEAARLRKQADYYTPENAAKALAVAAEMEKLVDASTDGQAPDPKLYKQIPDTARYGRLRGMWVRKEIYDDLMGVHDFMPTSPGIVQSLLGYGGIGTKATQLWKMSKVALNPPGQVRNFVSNAVMLQLSGVPLLRLADTMIRAGLQISGNGKHYQIAKKYGVTASTFSVQELGRIRTDLLALQARSRGFHPFTRLRLVAGTVANAASDAYQFSETLFKTAKIMDAMERQGLSEAEAAIEAHKWMFDYSLVPQGVRYARNAPIGVPFITYVYKVLPRLLEVALTAPWRALPWMGLMYGLGAAAASAFGVDDDDLEKLKKALPEWLQKRGNAAFLPFKDDLGRVQALDLGYFFPWSQWQEFFTALKHGEMGEAVQAAGLFSGPITDLIVAMKTGQNSFTKKPIWNEGDPTARQAADIANYIYDMAMPPFLGSHGVLSPMGLIDPQYGGKAVQASTGTTNKFGDPRATASQAALALVGVNLYALDPDHTRVQNILKLKREEQDSETRLRQQLQDRGLSDERRQALVKEYFAEIDRRTKKVTQYISDSEVHPNLKAANH